MPASFKKSKKSRFQIAKLFAEVFLVMSAFNLKSKIFKVVTLSLIEALIRMQSRWQRREGNASDW